jgi:fructokinase
MNVSAQHRVCIFGEILWDVFPEESILGGAPFNVAVHLQRFGVQAHFISRIGTDSLGEKALEQMAALGLSGEWIQRDATLPTGQVKVVLKGAQPRFEIGAAHAYDAIEVPSNLDVAGMELFYFGTLARRAAGSRKTARALAGTFDGAPRFADLNLREPWVDPAVLDETFRHADIIKLNQSEAVQAASMLGRSTSRDAETAASDLMAHYRMHQLIVTQGENGAFCIDAHGQVHTAAPVAVDVLRDTVGAGDAFSAAWILGILLRWDLPTLLTRANAFGAAVCTIRGALPPDRSLTDRFLREWGLGSSL